MHWIERNGVTLPRRVAGHPALDFCNTRAGWATPPNPRGEWLADYSTFVAWAGYADLLTSDEEARLSGRDDEEARAVLTDARRLRTVLRAVVLDPVDQRAADAVSGYVRRAGSGLRLRAGEDPSWHVRSTGRPDLPLLRVAWAALGLLGGGELSRVRTCPGDDCGWLFLDTSGRRRWCSMSSCGNRAKVRAHAARHR